MKLLSKTLLVPEAYLGPCHTCMVELFTKIVNDYKPLAIFTKSSIIDVKQGLNKPLRPYDLTQVVITCPKLAIETRKQGVKYVQS